MPTILWMWGRWYSVNSYYSHGLLVPCISLFLIWGLRWQLRAIPVQPQARGLWLFALGIIIHMVSALLGVYFTSGVSMLISLAGLVVFFFGGKILREVWFPIAFLLFMVPLPMAAIAGIVFKLKFFAAQMATAVLNLLHLPSTQVGSLILMEHANVVVDDLCGGLRSLIALTALGSIFAYGTNTSIPKRLLLFASAVPIAVLTNALRIIFLAAVTEILGAKYAEGLLHDIVGLLVFVWSFLLLSSLQKFLRYDKTA